MKKIFYLFLFLSLGYLTSCASRIQHTDPFYNINNNDYPWIYIPLVKPIRLERQDGRTPWHMSLQYGPWVSIPNSQEAYIYGVNELEKFAVSEGVIMAYSAYIDKEANAYIQDNYYHWFVCIPGDKIADGFHTEAEFLQYIQALGIKDPDWQTPDEAYERFKKTGCLEWIPDCE